MKRESWYAVTHRRSRFQLAAGVIAACLLAFPQAVPGFAQDHKNKIPIVSKITARPGRQAYTGTIQSLDLKQKVLSVNSRKGHDSAMFPLKRDVRVEALNGEKMSLKALTPGMSVLIYYEEKSGERNVKNIIVLESGKKGSHHAPAS